MDQPGFELRTDFTMKSPGQNLDCNGLMADDFANNNAFKDGGKIDNRKDNSHPNGYYKNPEFLAALDAISNIGNSNTALSAVDSGNLSVSEYLDNGNLSISGNVDSGNLSVLNDFDSGNLEKPEAEKFSSNQAIRNYEFDMQDITAIGPKDEKTDNSLGALDEKSDDHPAINGKSISIDRSTDFAYTFPTSKKERCMTMIEESDSQVSLQQRPLAKNKRFVEWKSEMTPLNEARLEELFDRRFSNAERLPTFVRRPEFSRDVDRPGQHWNSEEPSNSELAFRSKWNGIFSASNHQSSGEPSSSTRETDTSMSIPTRETDTETIFAQSAIGRRPSALENVREHFTVPQGESTDEDEGEKMKKNEADAKECRAIWRERYSLSRREGDVSSSNSGDLSDGEAISLSADEEQDAASNPSSLESEPEQCDKVARKKKRKMKRFSCSKNNLTNVTAVTTDGEDAEEDEGHVDDDEDSSLASSTSCSEDSFEIGTITDPMASPTAFPPRSVDDYVPFRHLLPLSPLKSRRTTQETSSRDNDEKVIDSEPSTSAKLDTRPACNDGGKVEKDNHGLRPVRIATDGNNISDLVPARDSTTASSPNQKSSSLAETASNATQSPPPERTASTTFLSSTAGLFSSITSPSTSFTSTTSRQRQSINEELSSLDTGLPQLDFEKLEKQLTDAAKEREMNQRTLMSEHVLRRLTTDTSDQPRYHPPAATKRPLRSNLGARLQSGMNLQVCFMNDAIPTDEDDELDEWDDDEDELGNVTVPKSRSTPNLGQPSGSGRGVGRSVSNCGDSTKRASELRKAMLERHISEDNDFSKRQARLEEEAKVMLVKAKQAAQMQMEMERQGKAEESIIEKVIGVPSLGRRKLTRHQLTKMCITQLQIILNELHSKVEALNDELVHLLMERDGMHMEQDSMLVDIEDLLQHQRCVDIPLPDFLVADPVITTSYASINNNNNNNKHARFRVFKR